jgi:hypothetical protein
MPKDPDPIDKDTIISLAESNGVKDADFSSAVQLVRKLSVFVSSGSSLPSILFLILSQLLIVSFDSFDVQKSKKYWRITTYGVRMPQLI